MHKVSAGEKQEGEHENIFSHNHDVRQTPVLDALDLALVISEHRVD